MFHFGALISLTTLTSLGLFKLGNFCWSAVKFLLTVFFPLFSQVYWWNYQRHSLSAIVCVHANFLAVTTHLALCTFKTCLFWLLIVGEFQNGGKAWQQKQLSALEAGAWGCLLILNGSGIGARRVIHHRASPYSDPVPPGRVICHGASLWVASAS